MKISRSKSAATAFSLLLMFAMALSLVVIPAVNAQVFEIYMQNYNTLAAVNTEVRLRFEVRMDGSRIRHTWENVTLNVKEPGSASWTVIGPFTDDDFDTSGRIYYLYTVTKVGVYQFYWHITAPQQELPANPATTDGSWSSEISETKVVLRL